jgi:undecaprenyl phosphate-alpha-L-ara4N flippase subunit ArnE
MGTAPWAIMVVLLTSFIGALGQYCFKTASGKLKFSLRSIIKNKYIFYGIGVYSFGTVIWLLVLPHGELSSLYPFVAVVYVWVAYVSRKYFQEQMNIWKWLGIISIIAGVSLVGLGI